MLENLQSANKEISKALIDNCVKELREEKNVSQEALAIAVETSQRNIGRWENGENEPSYKQLIKIADFFQVTLDYLIGREDDFGIIQGKTELSYREQKLLSAFSQIDDDEKDKIIEDFEYFANKHTKNLKKGY